MIIETPCVVVNMDKVEQNLERMAAVSKKSGCKLRPHVKTHKMPALAKLQMHYGACGITVAKLSEAETMADYGLSDIFMAYPLIGKERITRAMELGKKIRLICAVDCFESAEKISQICSSEGYTMEVRLEVDTGMHRSGIPYALAQEEAKKIASLPGISLQGIFTFRGMIFDGEIDADRRKCGIQEGRLMAELADQMRMAGIPIEDVSVGSTPTAEFCAEVPGVTEIRPGTYIFQDMMQVNTGVCGMENVAAEVWTQVVSSCKPEVTVIDCGCKSIATDVAQGVPPYYLKGFGHVIGHSEFTFARLSEEHGMLHKSGNSDVKVGDILRIIPNHICPTVNLYDEVYLMRGGEIVDKVRVYARGKNT